jgi:hypothetical protein
VSPLRAGFVPDQLDGPTDEPRPGASRKITDEQVEEVVVKTLESTPMDATRLDAQNPPRWLAAHPRFHAHFTPAWNPSFATGRLPGAQRPGRPALEQAGGGGKFTPVHEAW